MSRRCGSWRTRTRGPVYRRTVQTTLKASYTNHYRRGLIKLLDVLDSRSSNHMQRPVIESLALVARYAAAGNTTYYPLGEAVPVHKAMGGDWAEVVHRTDKRGRRRVVRMVYEVVAFQALHDQLKCRSGSSAPTSGETPTRTCPRTSPSGARRTTASCASCWTPPSSSTSCASR